MPLVIGGYLVHIDRFVSKLLGLPQRVDVRIPSSKHRDRWTVFDGNHIKVYLDHFVSEDWTRDLSTYPKQFFSVGLAEFVEGGSKTAEGVPGEVAWMLLIIRPGDGH